MKRSRATRGIRWKGLDKTWFKRELARMNGLRCAMCGKSKHRKELVIDHIKPWSKGGPTKIENLQLLCGPCDVAKGAS
jgi:5-methylcytosine-specific restriction endonuclease McrA